MRDCLNQDRYKGPVQKAGGQQPVEAPSPQEYVAGMEAGTTPTQGPALWHDPVQAGFLFSHWADRDVEPGRQAEPGHPGAQVQLKAGPVVQRYVETPSGGKNWRIADDLNMAVRQDSPIYGGRHFYADPSLITASNAILGRQGSHLTLRAGSETMKVASVDGSTSRDLTRVEPANKDNATSGNDRKAGMQWPDDCGEAANSIMQGKGRGGRAVFYGPPAGFIEKIISLFSRKKRFERETREFSYGSDTGTYKGGTFYSPHLLLDEIFKAALEERDANKAWARYQALSPADKDKFDREVGINKYAQAEVGEAYSIVASKEDFLQGKSAWNFHWGGVVMRSGGDSVTMENFANSGTDAWDFQMYGPPTKAGQTFHEQQASRMHNSTPEYGDHPTTIRVRKGD